MVKCPNAFRRYPNETRRHESHCNTTDFGVSNGSTITETDFKPPRPLSIAAHQTWERHADRIHAEGRWQQIDHDTLCLYCETVELYLRFKRDIDDHGTLVHGRTLQEKVRNPSLTGLSQARADLIRLAKAVPLVHPKPDMDGVEVDAFLEEIMR